MALSIKLVFRSINVNNKVKTFQTVALNVSLFESNQRVNQVLLETLLISGLKRRFQQDELVRIHIEIDIKIKVKSFFLVECHVYWVNFWQSVCVKLRG